MEDYWTECQYYDIVWVCFMLGNCNHCCFCCGHPCTMLGVSLFISCKNKIQCVCVCVWKKKSCETKKEHDLNLKLLQARSGFLNLCTADTLDRKILCSGGCPEHCRMLSRTPGIMVNFMCQLDGPQSAQIKHYFWVCQWERFRMRLACESVDLVKQIVLSNVGGHHAIHWGPN